MKQNTIAGEHDLAMNLDCAKRGERFYIFPATKNVSLFRMLENQCGKGWNFGIFGIFARNRETLLRSGGLQNALPSSIELSIQLLLGDAAAAAAQLPMPRTLTLQRRRRRTSLAQYGANVEDKVARWPQRPPSRRNPRKGRDSILQRSVAEP